MPLSVFREYPQKEQLKVCVTRLFEEKTENKKYSQIERSLIQADHTTVGNLVQYLVGRGG